MSVDRSALRVLVFHRAVGFVHLSIPDAVAAIEHLGAAARIRRRRHRRPWAIRRRPRCVRRRSSSCTRAATCCPRRAQRAGLERYLADGGGFFGIHAASSMAPDVASDWPWFRDLVGAVQGSHGGAHLQRRARSRATRCRARRAAGAGSARRRPLERRARRDELRVGDRARGGQPTARAIGAIVDGDTLVDEWYGFHENPRPEVNVVATVDESTYEPYLGRDGRRPSRSCGGASSAAAAASTTRWVTRWRCGATNASSAACSAASTSPPASPRGSDPHPRRHHRCPPALIGRDQAGYGCQVPVSKSWSLQALVDAR